MKIASWNINGVKARIETVLTWLNEEKPDIACFQEIKSVDETFPREPFEALGYHLETHGQKGFNGVAILSRLPFEEVNRRLPGDESDEQARYIEGVFATKSGPLRIGCLYLPNGNPVDSEKYPYKLRWMERLEAHARKQLEREEAFLLVGDYNVIPEARDAKKPESWVNDALFLPQTREAWHRLLNLGFTEAIRATNDADETYTFWDYQAGAWPKNNGIRIDHLLLSAQASDRMLATGIDRHVRGWDKPSDHVPVWVQLRD
ncbi:exodeoxyribonuclease III [Polycladidibacter stylochi]|uniref:exodeoxyribonuclease III n=1 Tax=Polycladidibacter stylochi TaxID=1807766 RepID=UPI00082C49FE|nr:exodeoxyribonuclease III [Pseudovibrio stylochi]